MVSETKNTTPTGGWRVPPGYNRVESALEGVSVYAPRPEDERLAAPRTYTCPRCGASTRYDVAASGVVCEHCGYQAAVEAKLVGRGADRFEFTLETLSQAEQGWGVDRREIHCDACGAELALAASTLTAVCPFCASNRVILRKAASDRLRPRFLVPFKIKPEEVRAQAAKWLGEGWFHPRNLAQDVLVDHFVGVYLPFWTFDARMDCTWQAEVGRERVEHNRDGSTRTVKDWSWRFGRLKVNVNDLLVNGSSHISQMLVNRLLPFNLGDLATYSPDYLAGWGAHAYDIGLTQAWEEAKQQMRERAREECHRDINASHVRNFSMKADFGEETWRYVLLPVYLTSYRYEDKIYQVMVNGQHGKVAGQKPVDWTKIWLAIAGMLLPGFILGGIGLPLLLLSGIGVVPLLLGFGLLVAGIILSVMLYRKAVASEAA